MKFDLSTLGPREFENLAQTLALAELGSVLTLFGAGPDGGREATFDGPVTFGVDGPLIEGYGVLQAKYCESTTTPQKDATWLIAQIRDELDNWKNSTKRNRKPDCLVFVTNVTLSGVPRTGGIDRVEKELKKRCEDLGISRWYVWHGETVHRLLEKHPQIRTSYAAWVLPGDVLSEMHAQLSVRKREVGKALQRYLAKELLRDLHVNLDQAGSADDLQIPLADVFIDLPMGPSGQGVAPPHNLHTLRYLIDSCDSKTWTHRPNFQNMDGRRFVLVGGPGQGKSTVSQFLCQIYRSRLVDGTSVGRATEVAQAVKLIANQTAAENLTPNSHRWPVKVILTQLADDLARGRAKSLLQFIALRVTDATDVNVTPQDLRDWLVAFPWLLLLDGLDEVPASSNRDQVLAAVNEFLIDVEEASADVMIVATTRPQGYTEEFSPSNYLHLELNPLGKERALHYAKKLATARHGEDSERTSRLMGRLTQAADEESTARLMSSPLQVTIMAVLLDRMGKAPKDRYTLFKDYYRVIYERELEKEGPATNLLRDHRADIDAIHADVGLLLQTRSERSGDTESRIGTKEFSSIIEQRLASEGHSGASLESLTKAISLAATDRLVFLVPSRAGEVGFEIRSLQEFWAADALMSASDEQVRDRLTLISVSSHWRNVLLFAVGKIYAERRHLRDSVSVVVAELNLQTDGSSPATRRLALGSRLAVDILADGMVKAPKHEAVLVDQAMRLFSLPAIDESERLLAALSENGLKIAKGNLENRIREGGKVNEIVLVFLGHLIARGDEWARGQVERFYANLNDEEKDEFLVTAFEFSSGALMDLVSDHLLQAPVSDLPNVFSARWQRPYATQLPTSERLAWIRPFIAAEESPRSPRFIGVSILVGDGVIGCSVSTIFGHPVWSDVDLSQVPSNHWTHAVRAFAESPSPCTLKNAVLAVNATGYCPPRGGHFLPWPVASVLEDLQDGVTSTDLLDNPSYVGDQGIWREMEDSWKEAISINDLCPSLAESLQRNKKFLPLSAVSTRTFNLRHLTPQGPLSVVLDSVSQGLATCLPGQVRAFCTQTVLGSIRILGRREGLSYDEVEALKVIFQVGLEEGGHVDLGWLSHVKKLKPGFGAWIDSILTDAPGTAWIAQAPPVLVREWVADFSQLELGKTLCIADFRVYSQAIQRAISKEWARVKKDDSIDIKRRGAVCLAVNSFEVCKDEADREARISTILEAASADVFAASYAIIHVYLAHHPIQHQLAFGLIDALPDLSFGLSEFAMDRLVADATSIPTKIDFSTMRAW
ncbi:NACHT domain-containing protein [Streptomyces sp. DT171]|uniref:NACHT domain-containing protein n=1 Tax=Streptomyces sp. DT171 TaxID=3416524 RepID=UPI003CF49345